jgi:catechol 2,3-dioxygenase-like lactoylglutathione lyase family enzyme
MIRSASRLAVVLLGSIPLFAQTESAIVGVGNFLHIVSDLDRSIAFYHDTVGLEIAGPPGEHKFTDNPVIANLYGVPGKQFRAAVLKVPGTAMGIELVQWGEAREPKGQPLSDSGAVTLTLYRGEVRSLHDPDGFPVAVKPAGADGPELSVRVRDAHQASALYASSLGLKRSEDSLAIPADSLGIRFTPAKVEPELSRHFPEPGEGMLRLRVRDIAALTESLKSAGFNVITTGGAPVTLPQGPRVIILRDPNNFFIQLMEAR